MMLALAGCGHGDSQKAAPSTVTVTSQVTAEPAAEPDPTTGWTGRMIATYELGRRDKGPGPDAR